MIFIDIFLRKKILSLRDDKIVEGSVLSKSN